MSPIPQTQAFAERLRQALEAVGSRPSPTLVANAFNQRYWGRSITPHTARNWLLGRSLPTQDKLVVLADWLQVSPDELRFGQTTSAFRIAEADAQFENLNMADREMIGRYLSLPASDRKTVRDVVAAMAVAAGVRRQQGG
jgi:transcriptional regulator with XRE-family HTH domain